MKCAGLMTMAVLLAPGAPLSAQGSGFAIRDGDYLSPITVPADPDMKKAPSMKGCDRSKQSVGYIVGSGVISYVIGTDGHADTASVKVVSHETMSAPALISVARRVLVTCSFRAAESVAGKAPALVAQRLSFTSATGMPAPRVLVEKTDSSAAAAGDTSIHLHTSISNRGDSGAVEATAMTAEGPARLSCPTPKFTYSGAFALEFIVGKDGRVEPASVAASGHELLPPDLVSQGREMLVKCIFAPGRIDGVPVRVLVRQPIVLYPYQGSRN
ncbi:MAG TPA: hypothetical protein VJN95_12710 [Gemmatimonadales bacterium]|nr:hypothetical protein [Gemmatimonadales bacterium]